MENPLKILRDRNTAKLSASLADFSQRAWREIEPRPIAWSWHMSLICEYLQLCLERKVKRLIITCPPRATKSRLVEVMFPSFCWQRDPSLRFIFTSYSDLLSSELSVVRRNLLSSPWFQSTFPGRVEFASDQNMKTVYENSRFGIMRASSMTGSVAGMGGDFLVVDDALSPQQAFSDVEREGVNRDFDSSFRSRLNSPDEGCIIVIQQRLHQNDLVGHLNENEPGVWTNVVIPMVCEQDTEIIFPISKRRIMRRAGDLLQPSRFPASWVAREKSVGSYRWNSQYQQHPSPPGGAIFHVNLMRQYDELPRDGRTIIALDTAFSVKKSADYSAASVWRAREGRYHLAWAWRDRVEYPQLKAMTEELAATWQADTILIEKRASGQSLLQSLQQETSLPVVGFEIGAEDKAQRAHAVTALFESGRVFIPRAAPWLADFLSELEMFPTGAHDDWTDTLTMALAFLREQEYGNSYAWLDMNADGSLLRMLGDRIAAGAQVVKDAFGRIAASPRDDNRDAKKLFPLELQARGLDPQTVNPCNVGVWKQEEAPPCIDADCRKNIPKCTIFIGSGGNGVMRCRCQQCGREWWKDGIAPLVTYAVRDGGYVQRPMP